VVTNVSEEHMVYKYSSCSKLTILGDDRSKFSKYVKTVCYVYHENVNIEVGNR
jgi:hypothetical protein